MKDDRKQLIQQMFEAIGLGTLAERQKFIKFVKEPVSLEPNTPGEHEQMFIRSENGTANSEEVEHG